MRGWDHIYRLKALDENNVGIPTLLMHSDKGLLPRLIAVWPMVSKRLTNPGLVEDIPAGLPATEHTRYLWACIEPEPEPIWAESAGLPMAPHVRRGMMILLDNAVVFPDGEMSELAKRYLNTEAERFGIKSRSQGEAT